MIAMLMGVVRLTGTAGHHISLTMEATMPAPYSATTVANEFIALAEGAGRPLTPMQINKLTYIAHGFSLAVFRRPLIREAVEAWKYGPVIPSVYRKLKRFGSSVVDEQIAPPFLGRAELLDDDDKKLIRIVFDKYGYLTGSQLSHLTHKPGTPWEVNYTPGEYGTEIDNGLIRSHYTALLRPN